MRRLVQAELTDVLDRFDVLVGPNVRVPPGPLGGGTPTGSAMGMATEVSYTRPFNLTGKPSLSVPAGLSPEGLPVGLQVSGRSTRTPRCFGWPTPSSRPPPGTPCTHPWTKRVPQRRKPWPPS